MADNDSCKNEQTDGYDSSLKETPKAHNGYWKYALISFLMCAATALGLVYVLEYKDSQRVDQLKLDIKNTMSDFYVSVKSGDTKTLDLMSSVMSRIDTQQTSINELNSSWSQIRAETKEAIADAVALASSNDQAMMRAVISEHMLRISSEDMAMRSALKSVDEELSVQRALIADLRNTINGRAGKTASEEAASSLSYARSAKDSDRNLSELYYVKAITLMPNDTSVISEYVDFVLSGVRNNDEITSVRDKLARSSSVIQAAIANADSDKVSQIREELDKINDRFKQWESANKPKELNIDKLTADIKAIEADSINLLYENEKKLIDIAETMNKQPSENSDYKKLISDVIDKLQRVRMNIDYKKTMDNVERLLGDASKESNDTYRSMLLQSAMGQLGALVSMRNDVSPLFSSKLKDLVRKVESENDKMMEKLRKTISSTREDIRRMANDSGARVGKHTARIHATQMLAVDMGMLCNDIILPQYRLVFMEKRNSECENDLREANGARLSAYNDWAAKTIRGTWYDFKSKSNYTAHMRDAEEKDKGRTKVSGVGNALTGVGVGLGSAALVAAGVVSGPVGWVLLGLGGLGLGYAGSKGSEKLAETVYQEKYDPAWEKRSNYALNILRSGEFAKIDARYLTDQQVLNLYSETFGTILAVAGSDGKSSSLWDEIQRVSTKRPIEDF